MLKTVTRLVKKQFVEKAQGAAGTFSKNRG
jgi:hypothetical protein